MGMREGSLVGSVEGPREGRGVRDVGSAEGSLEGSPLGLVEGSALGLLVFCVTRVGDLVGIFVGYLIIIKINYNK